jgi:hypothetical protein
MKKAIEVIASRLTVNSANRSRGALVLNAHNHPLTYDGKAFSFSSSFTVFGTVQVAHEAIKKAGDTKMRVAETLVTYD